MSSSYFCFFFDFRRAPADGLGFLPLEEECEEALVVDIEFASLILGGCLDEDDEFEDMMWELEHS